MRRPSPKLLLLIILIEGYVVLASELLAIRQLVPFVGSGTEVVSIIISAVLLPLAVGYHRGGAQRRTFRKKLVHNLVTALFFLTIGLSYLTLEIFFGALNTLGIRQPISQTAIYATLFLVYPVYLLGQTVPLISNYFPRQQISALTGRMLFFSTVGSFFGSVFSTLILMNTVGVHITVIVTLGLLTALAPLLSRRSYGYATWVAAFALLIVICCNSPATMRAFTIVSNNGYNMVSIRETTNGDRHMRVNRSSSSGINRDGQSIYTIIRYVDSTFITPISDGKSPARDMLILGAGGFTVGLNDTHNNYTFVDIDPALKTVAERDFLKKPLTPNKQFLARSARAYVHNTSDRYDFIFIDTFTNVLSAPMETVTREFLADAKKLLKPGGILAVNQVAYPDFADTFSIRYDRTFASVFGNYTRQIISPYNPWDNHTVPHNALYIYYDRPGLTDPTIYTDNRNSYSLDRKH